ncbi:hypothetical protein MTP99_004142 [Tenebrio molitor]|nr:hypothetical protein MTP99_004142 [Tenebrio molitor]
MEDLLKYGPLFLQMCYAAFAFFVLLLKNHMVENSMNVIELWQINTFVLINTALPLVWGTRIMSSDNDSELYFFQHILDKLCHRQANFFVLILKMTLYLAGLVMEVHAYQIIYCTQHIKFQMYMLSALIEKLGRDFEDSENLIRDEVYQEEIESKLKMIIDRHCDFIRWKNNTLMLMSNFIIPFTIGGIVIGISIVLSFLQVSFTHS